MPADGALSVANHRLSPPPSQAAIALTSSMPTPLQITPGGSLANTLVAIARLSRAAGRSQLNVALASSCSNDAIGQFFSSQLHQAGVAVLPTSETPGHTGTVFVLASEDASRSFLSYFHSGTLEVTPSLRRAVAKSRLVVIEGYLWELPNAAAAIAEVVEIARENGTQVALTAGDPGVVARHRQEILQVCSGNPRSDWHEGPRAGHGGSSHTPFTPD
jgi:sugar/nucleoside kinase (ribokinase family)